MVRNYLTGNFADDMRALRLRGKNLDEVPQFVTYLTLALQNLSDIIGVDLSGLGRSEAVVGALEKSGKVFEVVSFLWLHRIEEPASDYRDFAEWTRKLVVKLWEVRNMFVHSTADCASKVLIVEPDFYRFIEGDLYSEAREHALGPGRHTEKVFKLRLFCPNNERKTRYEFTRKGLIFLVCLALYRHDAAEFIQQFSDMRLPPKEWELEKGYKERPSEAELIAMRKKGGTVKAIIDSFTYFSMRSSRTDIDLDNADYLNFVNILTYLNKVPLASYDYLELKNEVEKLAKEAEESCESEENKRFKYALQARKKDRFLKLALAYIEDFDILPSIRFKRLDVTPHLGRKRYLFGPIPQGATDEFGNPLSDANGMDRHYAITGDVAQFEFVPKKHYGAIRIEHLRGGIGENEILRLLLMAFNPKGIAKRTPNDIIAEYLTAYHRILERMLNAETADELSLEDKSFRADFKLVSGKDDAALEKSRFVEEMKPFFPVNLTRFFVGEELKPTREQLQEKISRHLQAMRDRAEDFLLKMDKLTEWRKLDAQARQESGVPICRIGELKYPPRTCRFTDAQLVGWVLRYLNLHLTKENKYRQLPRGKRHRGVRDFEFQLLQTDIGRFGSNPIALWRTLEKREDLNGEDGALELLKAREGVLFRQETRRCKGRLDKNGRPLRVGHTLTMLATAAAELYAEYCASESAFWGGELTEDDADLLPYIAAIYGVKPGLPLEREAMIKTILGIDTEQWEHAYDYAARRPYENRRLENTSGLIAAQVPMPNLLAIRCLGERNEGFLFNPAFREFRPYERGSLQLRDFYDVEPLIASVKCLDGVKRHAEGSHERANARVDLAIPREESKGEFSRSSVNKAIQAIQRAERQDKILLTCACKYWDRYFAEETMSSEKKKRQSFRLAEFSDIGSFFRTPITDTVGGIKVRMMPNDFARPAYSVVSAHIAELAKRTAPMANAEDTYSFYDLWLTLRDLQRREASSRLRLLPAIAKFNALVEPMPRFEGGADEVLESMLKHVRKVFSFVRSPITEEEFKLILELDKRLRHPSKDGIGLLSLDLAKAESVLRRVGCGADLR